MTHLSLPPISSENPALSCCNRLRRVVRVSDHAHLVSEWSGQIGGEVSLLVDCEVGLVRESVAT